MVDVLLSTYNGERYLDEQISSILNQQYSNFKLLIRDDGSRDKTVQIIKKWKAIDNRIEFIEDNFGNLGISKSFSRLLKTSNADLIFFADQDDIWMSDKLTIFIESYKSLNTVGPALLHSNATLVDEKGENLGMFLKYVPEKNGLQYCLFHYFVQGASSMINKALKREALDLLDQSYLHDRVLHLICEIKGERYYINRSTMYYRQHGGNQIGVNSINLKMKNFLQKESFFINKDRSLIQLLFKIFPENTFLNDYLIITDLNISKIKRLSIFLKSKISMRKIDFIHFILK